MAKWICRQVNILVLLTIPIYCGPIHIRLVHIFHVSTHCEGNHFLPFERLFYWSHFSTAVEGKHGEIAWQ